jgi:hypothetical protein
MRILSGLCDKETPEMSLYLTAAVVIISSLLFVHPQVHGEKILIENLQVNLIMRESSIWVMSSPGTVNIRQPYRNESSAQKTDC